jgi:hypothetical protein
VKKIPLSVGDCSNGQSSGTSDFHTNPLSASAGVLLSLATETPTVINTSMKNSDRCRFIGHSFRCDRHGSLVLKNAVFQNRVDPNVVQ